MKHTPIDRRIKELEKELAEVHGSLKTLAKKPPKARTAAAPMTSEPAAAVAVAEMPPPTRSQPAMARPDFAAAESNGRGRDGRFVDYLASSLGPAQPLRRERNAERNRALLAIGFALLLLFWIVSRFLFL